MSHFFLPALLAAISIATAAEPLNIKPVKTWKELSEQTPIALKDGGTVRFGVEAAAAPINGGVMLYCMADQVPFEPLNNVLPEDCLGPFRLKLETPGKKTLQEKVQSVQAFGSQAGRVMIAQGRALYVQLIPVADKDGCRVSVLGKAGDVLASANIAASKEISQPWVGFADDRTPDQEVAKVDFEDKRRHGPELNVVAAMGGIRVPRIDGTRPLLYIRPDGSRGAVDFKDDQPLPGFLPFTGDTKKLPPGLKSAVTISIDGLKLDITTPLAFERAYFHDNFIARWWLNGKPVENISKTEGLMRNGGGRVSYHKEARLNLRIVPEALGAKKGDKISVQLLFCPDGSRQVGPEAMKELLAQAEQDEVETAAALRFPMVSNVVEVGVE